MNETWIVSWIIKRLADLRYDISINGNAIYDALGDQGNRGVVSAIMATVLTDSMKAWILNFWKGCKIQMLTGTAQGQWFPVSSSGLNTLTCVACDMVTAGVAVDDEYQIVPPSWDRARDWIATTDFKVLLGYARSPDQMPCFSVVRSSGAEGRQVIGRIIGKRDVVGSGEVTVYGSFWNVNYQIGIWTDNPDTSYWLHRILEYYYLLDSHVMNRLVTSGLRASGGDLAPQPEWFPSMVYLRNFELSCEIERRAEVLVAQELVDSTESVSDLDYANLVSPSGPWS